MFPVGQTVWQRDGRRSGKVLECDGDRVFIVQDNGVELDFRASDLTATPPAGVKAAGAKQGEIMPAGQGALVRRLTPSEITPEHVRVLGVVPVRTLQAVAAVFARRPGGKNFSALDVAEKLNIVADTTGVPYRTMRQYSDRPGELGLLMGKGLADSIKRV